MDLRFPKAGGFALNSLKSPGNSGTYEVCRARSVGAVITYHFHHGPGSLLVRWNRQRRAALSLQANGCLDYTLISSSLAPAACSDPCPQLSGCREFSWHQCNVLVVISSMSSAHGISDSRLTSEWRVDLPLCTVLRNISGLCDRSAIWSSTTYLETSNVLFYAYRSLIGLLWSMYPMICLDDYECSPLL